MEFTKSIRSGSFVFKIDFHYTGFTVGNLLYSCISYCLFIYLISSLGGVPKIFIISINWSI